MGQYNQILLQIQEKREKMINSANKNGYTSEDTIRCSQELDQLIFEYQKERFDFHFKKMILAVPDRLPILN